jgi:3-methyladenine DNA glycosylase AlkC|tara:strand:- start:363 stop:788 length:426 start_codon:yes stop_codon:yes gene_type:complete
MVVNIELDKENNRIYVRASVTKRLNSSKPIKYLDTKGVIIKIKERFGLVVTRKQLLNSITNIQNDRDSHLTGEWIFEYKFRRFKPKPVKKVMIPVKELSKKTKSHVKPIAEEKHTVIEEKLKSPPKRKRRTRKKALDITPD